VNAAIGDRVPRIRVIVNGAAGGGRAGARVAPALDRLRAAGTVDVRTTTGPGHATALANDAVADQVDAVVAAGGDGTLFEVVNGLLPKEGAGPPLGILAVGTGNSFVRDVGLTDPLVAADAIVAGRTRPVDVLRLEDDDRVLYAINLVSLGFSADAGALVNRRFKGLGIPGYGLAVVATLASLRALPVSCQIDERPPELRDVTLISFCNSRFTGGTMMMAPAADPADGWMDVIDIGRMGRRRLLTSFPRIFRGTHLDMPEVRVVRARRVAFAPMGTVDVMVDGEVLGLELRSLEVVPGAIELLA
jgi:YegS/Rv2252/BmrU family lipid kinase